MTVFQDAGYRRLWASGLCVNVARWMDLVTLGWLALQLTGSPFMVAVAAFARAAPMMVLGPFTGIIADRVSRGHLLLVTQAGNATVAVALATLFGAGAGAYAPLVALELAFGMLWSLDFPARRTALFSMLGASRVAQAVSLETVSMQIAKMGGPLIAGACLARLGPAACYGVMATVALAGFVVSLGLQHRIEAPRAARASSSLAATLASGLHAAWESGIVRAVLLITIAMNVLFFPYQHMLPVFARDVLAGGPTTLGALVAADGLGSLAGALAIAAYHGRLAHGRLFATAVLVAPFILVAFSASRSLASCLAFMVVIGVAESGFAAMQSTLVLLAAPAHARGGAMGILSACIGTQPLGTLAIGALAGTLGAPRAFALNAIVALAAIVPLAVPLVRRR
ncbi:MAG: MFS transporter [Candidatus Rokubacteria bacterium]|nr:MFS transporter [Candidatus Rokubacteria bacterium]